MLNSSSGLIACGILRLDRNLLQCNKIKSNLLCMPNLLHKHRKTAAVIVGLVALTFLAAPLVFDNVDNKPWGESTLHGQTVFVGNQRILVDEQSQAHMAEHYQATRLESVRDILTATSNACLGGQDPSKMTIEQQINAFIEGPCNPVVLVPGLAGTSLQVKIDCEKLQAESPHIFEGCGWSTCSSYQVWKKRPDTEYRLWISSVSSPVGIIMASKKNKCFGDVIELLYNPMEPDVKKRYSDPPGLEVTYYGDTPKTNQNSECGLGAIAELTDDHFIKLATCEHKGFLNLAEMMKGMGYISGLTMQAIPYDYRKDIVSGNVPELITQSIQNMRRITGKKTIIMTHSLGSLYAVHTLNVMSQMWKQDYVASLITMGGPYLGSTKVLRSNLGGDPSYLDKWLGHDVGINYYCQNKAINSGSSGADLYPKDSFFRFVNEPWMKDIIDRINYEKEFLETQSVPQRALPIDWFPGPTENCTQGFSNRPNNCLTLLSDMTKPFMQIGEQVFKSQRDDIDVMLQNYSVNGTKLSQYYQESQLPTLDNLDHPGVPTIVVYGNFMSVEERQLTYSNPSFIYSSDPKVEVGSRGDFYFPTIDRSSVGDGTVMGTSAITPAIKWIHEHKNNKTSHPTKLVEFCSSYNSGDISSIFDDQSEAGKGFKQSGYHGINCECLNQKDAGKCKHSCMINDKHLVELASQAITTGQKSIYANNKTPLSIEELNSFLSNCANIGNKYIQVEA